MASRSGSVSGSASEDQSGSESGDQQSGNFTSNVNVDISDKPVDEESIDNEHSKAKPKSPSVQVQSSIRTRRKTNISLAGKESKISELHVVLGKNVNVEYRNLQKVQGVFSDGVNLEELYDIADDMDARMGRVCDVYNELFALCDKDENKISTQTKTNYSLLLSHAEKLKSAMEQQMDVLEEEEKNEADQRDQEKKVELEEEAKIFASLLEDTSEITFARKKPEKSTDTTIHNGAGISTANGQDMVPAIQNNGDTARPDAAYSSEQGRRASTTDPKMVTEEKGMADFSKFMRGLTEVLEVSTKKSVKPEVFNGDVLTFSDWEVDLDAYFRVEKISGYERLRHLKNFIDGDARKCVEGHFITNTNEAYLAARATLKERYGNEYQIARSFRKKLEDWPKVGSRDGNGLREFSDYLCYLQTAMASLKQLSVLDDCVENEKMTEKLPEWLRLKWARIVGRTQATEQMYPKFAEFVQLIKEEAYIMNLEISKVGQREKTGDRYGQSRTVKSYMTAALTDESATDRQCLFCKLSNHRTSDCYRLQKLCKEEKDELVRANRLCFKCFEPGHVSKDCNNKKKCLICSKPHATVKHDPNWEPQDLKRRPQFQQQGQNYNNTLQANLTSSIVHDMDRPSNQTAACSSQGQLSKEARLNSTKELGCQATGIGYNLSSPGVPVYISAGTGREVLAYAMLDTMSDACYISAEVIRLLKANTSEIERDVTIHTINGALRTDVERIDDIIVRGYTTENTAKISAYKKDSIFCKREQLPNPEKAKKVSHLIDIAEEIPPLLDIPIGLLIGHNHPEIIQPIETRPAPAGTTGIPYGQRTLFGWTMGGGAHSNRDKSTFTTDMSKDTQLMNILERDFRDLERNEVYQSQEDIKFIRLLEQSTEQGPNGNYVMPLPLRGEIQLPNNRRQAEKRLEGLTKRFKTNSEYKGEYTAFMDNLFLSGHAEETRSIPEDGKVWYIPHFGVRHKQKKKLRVVFDASAAYHGMSLNDTLMSGPDHINSLLGILLRFRKEPIAITCDIQHMFYNFQVKPEHRDYLRFLWTDNQRQGIKEYRMNVHLFGAKSSPAVATFGLRRLANDYSYMSTRAAKFLQDDFYVDDGVTSVATTQEARELIKEATDICSKANIRLHKFLSNHKDVLSSVPQTERGESTKSLDLFHEQLPSDRTLGMEWCLETDRFHFKLPDSLNNEASKRSLLSTIAQIYDPMGLVSPFILKGKHILQRVTSAQTTWDQLLGPEDKNEWTRWLLDLQNLRKIKVNRCVKPQGTVKSVELHHFGDGSTQGYGACSYVRQITDKGLITCNLLLSKARVAPLKKITTIPRLELQGAVTAVKLANTIKKELNLKIDKEYFWSDSNITLGYLNNEVKRFHVYVANRVADIKHSTTPSQWNHVSTKDNPADLTSRGSTAVELMENPQWLEGPSFLKTENLVPYIEQNKMETSLNPEDPELRKVITTLATSTTISIADRFSRYGEWKRLVRSIAILKTCIKRKKGKGRFWRLHDLTTNDMVEAEEFIIRAAQQANYPVMEKEQSLTKLNAQLDEKGILRVGGRAGATNWSYLQKHPIIVPKHTHISRLIIRHYHERIFHLGHRSTLGEIRENGYWPISGATMVKSALNKCVTCRYLRNGPQGQIMGNLPEERLERTAPFTNIGMDVFGPFYIKERRSEMKRWGLMITCLYSRAVHIEILEDMTTDCLIQALRCFMAIRGPVKTIICDNGTNFVGTKNELQKQINATDPEMREYLLQNSITFKFNSPEASHQGGVTERMIRSARAVLNGMSQKYKCRMDTKTLRTAFYETANIINSRPLTGTSILNPEEVIMTPSRLLTGKSLPLLAAPPGKFTEDDVYSSRRWKISQAIAEEFWKAWRADYFNCIMQRQKWTDVKENLKVGDVVLLKDDDAARCDWRIGRISGTMPGKDGLVRNVELVLGNKYLDRKGQPLQPPTILRRPIQKIIVLVRV